MEALDEKCRSLSGPSSGGRLSAYVQMAGSYLAHENAAYRTVACEFLARFPQEAVEADLTPAVGNLGEDNASAFKGVNFHTGQQDISATLAGSDGSVTVADVAALALGRMTQFRFADCAAFRAWWRQNNDYRKRLWYWSLRWRDVRANHDQAAIPDLAHFQPMEALRLMLLVDNDAAKVADAGLHEASMLSSGEPSAVQQVEPNYPAFAAKTMADFVRAHSFKEVLLRIIQQDVPWPEARSERSVIGLWIKILPILPQVLEKSDAEVIEKVLVDARGPMALTSGPWCKGIHAEFSRVAIALDPLKAEEILISQLKREPRQPVLAAQLIMATGLKHWDLVQAACPGRPSKSPVIKALARLHTPDAASALAQWFNAEDWTPNPNDIKKYGYEVDSSRGFLLRDFVKAAAALNGGNPVISRSLLDRARWKTGKWTTEEQKRNAREANKAVLAARAEVVAQLKHFFAKFVPADEAARLFPERSKPRLNEGGTAGHAGDYQPKTLDEMKAFYAGQT